MASEPLIEKTELDEIFKSLLSSNTSEPKTTKPKEGLDEHVNRIYEQADRHRDTLLHFYILYTIIFSLFVITLIVIQVYARIYSHSETIEIIPQWALYLLVIGMFGQFISLLAIVTTKVWTFEPFLKHYESQKEKNKKEVETKK